MNKTPTNSPAPEVNTESGRNLAWKTFSGGTTEERSNWEMEQFLGIQAEPSYVDAYNAIHYAVQNTCDSITPTIYNEGTNDESRRHAIPNDQLIGMEVEITYQPANGDYWVNVTDKKRKIKYSCIIHRPFHPNEAGGMALRVSSPDHSTTVMDAMGFHIENVNSNNYYIDPEEQAFVRTKMQKIATVLAQRLKTYGPESTISRVREAITQIGLE